MNERVGTAQGGGTVSRAGSATGRARRIEESAQSIQAVNRTLREDQELRTVGEAMGNVAGVAPQGQMELVLQAPKIRGFDTAYLIDGLPAYNLPASASDPGSLINVARVEVAKGPTSTPVSYTHLTLPPIRDAYFSVRRASVTQNSASISNRYIACVRV